MAAELGEVQVRRGGDALVGGDVAGQAAARVARRVVGGAHGQAWPSAARQAGSAKASSACRRRLSRGTTQQTRSQSPAPISAWAAITGSSDLPPPGRDRGEDVAHAGGLAGGNGADNGQQFALMAAQGRGQASRTNTS